MTLSFKHAFQSAKGDGLDTTKVRPSAWNAEHSVVMSGAGLIGKPDSGSGAAVHLTLGDGLAFDGTQLKTDAGVITAAVGLVGEIKEYAGITLPALYLWAAGQAVSRATYAALLAAITALVTGTTTSGNATIASVNTDLRFLGVEGAFLEGTGIPSGTTIVSVTATTIVMSANATASGTVSIRVLPWGRGDGSTTFNVPDKRGRVGVGRDNMNGTTSGRITNAGSGIIGTRLNAAGGAEDHTLTSAQMPAHHHSGTTNADGNHTHTGTTDAGGNHTHTGTTDADGNHNHGGTTGNKPAHSHTYTRYTSLVSVSSGSGANAIWQGTGGSDDTSTDPAHNHTIPNSGTHTHTFAMTNSGTHTHTFGMTNSGTHTHAFASDDTGGGAAHNNTQPSIMTNYIVFAGV